MRNLKFTLHFGGVFGGKEEILNTIKDLIDGFAQKGPFSKRQILNICKKLEKILQKSFRNQQVKVSPVFYPDKSCFLDVDIFSPKKKSKFQPSKTIRFPNHLMGFWKEYQKGLFFRLEKVERKKVEQKIKIEVNKNLKRLFLVLSQDKNPEKRAIAAYLLSFSEKSQEASKFLLRAFGDNEHFVHNAAGWSLVGIVSEHEIKIPLKLVVSLIHHSFPGCRNKGLVLLEHLLKERKRKDFLLIKRLAQQRLLKISKNNQPNYYFAKQLLKKLEEI